MRCGMRCGMGCGMWDVWSIWARGASGGGRACVLSSSAASASSCIARRRAAARTAWPRHIAAILVAASCSSPLKRRASLSRRPPPPPGGPLKKSPIDLSARAVSCSSSFSSSSSPSSPRPRSRSPPRPAAAAGAGAGAAPNDSRGTAAACAADELGAETTSGGAVGRRTRSATTPAASRSIAAACSEPPISTPLIVVTSSPGVTPAAAARPPGWSALTMARCGAAVAAASFRSNEMPIRTVGSDFASLIVRNSSGGGGGGARTRGAAPPPFWRKRPLDMVDELLKSARIARLRRRQETSRTTLGSQQNSESSRRREVRDRLFFSRAMEGDVGAPALADAGAQNLWQRMFGSDAGASIFSADADGLLESEESSDGPPAAGADCCELTPPARANCSRCAAAARRVVLGARRAEEAAFWEALSATCVRRASSRVEAARVGQRASSREADRPAELHRRPPRRRSPHRRRRWEARSSTRLTRRTAPGGARLAVELRQGPTSRRRAAQAPMQPRPSRARVHVCAVYTLSRRT